MENAFYCLLSSETAEHCGQVECFLGPDKPVLDDDVAEPWQACYRALEFVVEPVYLHREDNRRLWAGWDIHAGFEVAQTLIAACCEAGCEVWVPTLWLGGDVLAIENPHDLYAPKALKMLKEDSVFDESKLIKLLKKRLPDA